MKISTKGRYALRMALDLAEHQNEGYISLKEIAGRQEISKKYLEQIVPLLSKSGLLRTNRGNRGGYMLAKSADVMTVGEILRATEGNLAPVSCLEYPENTCFRAEECAVLYIWEGLHKTVCEYLDHITLRDILEHNHAHIPGGDYCI
ncbi:MAG: Rrf2 family transcriptional regulator [Oscillospiraceae bacterium]|nr:Rrf2 family transcriptional regulator [Oscillospiraceae bacterium]